MVLATFEVSPTAIPDPIQTKAQILTLDQCLGSWSCSPSDLIGLAQGSTLYIYKNEEDTYYIDIMVEFLGYDSIYATGQPLSDLGNIWITDYYESFSETYGRIAITPTTESLTVSISIDGPYSEVRREVSLEMSSVPFKFVSVENKTGIPSDQDFPEYDEEPDWSDEPVAEDPYTYMTEFQYITMLEQQYALFVPNQQSEPDPNDILRNFDLYSNQPLMYKGYVKWVSSYESGPKSFLLQGKWNNFIIQCYTATNIPLIEGDYIEVYGEPDYITSYKSTDPTTGYSREVPTFNIKVRYYDYGASTNPIYGSQPMTDEEKAYFFDHTYRAEVGSDEIYLTETTINGVPYTIETSRMSLGEIELKCTSDGKPLLITLDRSGVINIAWNSTMYYGNHYYNISVHSE